MNYKNCNGSNIYSPATILFLYSLIHTFVLFSYQEAKLAQEKIPPWELFKKETDKYSQFDDKVGIIVIIDLIMKLFLSLCYFYYYLVTQVLKGFFCKEHMYCRVISLSPHQYGINHMNSVVKTSSFDISSGNSHT